MTALPRARLIAIGALLLATSASAQAPAKTPTPPKRLQTRVWVNTATRVYHCPGSEYYGKTRSGEFMEEAQARGFGIRAVNARGCNNVVTPGLAPLPDAAKATRQMVWLNTESGVYHCPHASDWGTTRRGRYLTESDASASGNKPAAGWKCDAANRAK